MEKLPVLDKPVEKHIEEKPDKINPEDTELKENEPEEEELKLRKISGQAAFEMMYEEKSIFPPEIQAILEKKKSGEKLTSEEISAFDLKRNQWWEQKFGSSFVERWQSEEEKLKRGEFLIQRRKYRAEKLGKQKEEIMEKLMLALKNLDIGEPVEQFRQQDRRVLYFDEESNRYFTLRRGVSYYLGIGDILSDYAWKIRYMPDGEMIKPEYRRIAKRILINEARRDLEKLYDLELSRRERVSRAVLPKKLKSVQKLGVIAEVMATEVLSRISVNNDLNFITERANVLEDSRYKYDFKVRSRKKKRGVGIGGAEDIEDRIKKIGIQFTINSFLTDRKKGAVAEVKEKYKNSLPVDDIILIKMDTAPIFSAFRKWIKSKKSSGGPEQFLPEWFKKDLLEKVTEGLF